ncbi:chaplin family protein [Streptomyces sp. NPDC018029]|uniref:chaplin family protein n=1 Tax=Streptomyces sp. NPDC018029 TaxID=3365032 RepID=UPI0037AC2E46
MRTRSILTTAAFAAVTVIGGAGAAVADPDPVNAEVSNSPGIISGNAVQVPVDVDVPICGNTIDIVGVLNPATGNHCKTN